MTSSQIVMKISSLGRALTAASILATFSTSGFCSGELSSTWKDAEKGLSVVSSTINHNGSSAKVIVIRADQSNWQAKVIDTAKPSKYRSTYQYSLQEIQSSKTFQILINGGFTESFTYPIPVGLMISDGNKIKNLNGASKLLTGVFAADRKSWKIIPRSEFKNIWPNALQCGPMLVENNGRVAVNQQKESYRRSAIGLDSKGRLLIVVSEPTTLFDLAKKLVAHEKDGGFDCSTALNLSGDVETGLIIDTPRLYFTYGNIKSSIASAVGLIKLNK